MTVILSDSTAASATEMTPQLLLTKWTPDKVKVFLILVLFVEIGKVEEYELLKGIFLFN